MNAFAVFIWTVGDLIGGIIAAGFVLYLIGGVIYVTVAGWLKKRRAK